MGMGVTRVAVGGRCTRVPVGAGGRGAGVVTRGRACQANITATTITLHAWYVRSTQGSNCYYMDHGMTRTAGVARGGGTCSQPTKDVG